MVEGGGGGGGGGNCFVRGLLPFMFENMWLKKEGFKTLIDEWWRSFEIRGIGRYVLIEKLEGGHSLICPSIQCLCSGFLKG